MQRSFPQQPMCRAHTSYANMHPNACHEGLLYNSDNKSQPDRVQHGERPKHGQCPKHGKMPKHGQRSKHGQRPRHLFDLTALHWCLTQAFPLRRLLRLCSSSSSTRLCNRLKESHGCFRILCCHSVTSAAGAPRGHPKNRLQQRQRHRTRHHITPNLLHGPL